MGSCSNRGLTKVEKIAEHVKNIIDTKDTFSFDW